jgi:glycosyltransferase involved in cell wall biosynthesis
MADPHQGLNVWMTLVGRQGGMDRIAGLIVETMASQPNLGVKITGFITRGYGGILQSSLTFASAITRFWFAGRRGEIDVLHINLAAGGSVYRKAILARLARSLGIPYVVHLHGGRFRTFWPEAGPYVRRTIDLLFLKSAKIIVLGRFWESFVVERLPAAQSKIVVLPNATKSASDDPARRRQSAVHISFLGLLGPAKGTPELIQALGRLSKCDWTCTIAGPGDIATSRMQAENAGIAEKIDFPGWLDEAAVDAVLRRAEILVLPSRIENLPMVVLEGFAHGLAVVATPVGAIPDVIENERNGLIVPLGDVDALASALRRLIQDSCLRYRLGTAARHDHTNKYDIGAYVPRLSAIWYEAARSGKSS